MIPGTSKIPSNVNSYALQWGRRICAKPVENIVGMDYICRGVYDDVVHNKVISESPLFVGSVDTARYDFKRYPHDIIVHNHPKMTPLSLDDVDAAVYYQIDEIVASTKAGYTSLDTTTIKDFREARPEILLMTQRAIHEQNNFVDSFYSHKLKESTVQNYDLKIITEFLLDKISDFCNVTGAIFKRGKWQ